MSTVLEEDAGKDTAFMRGSGMQWPFSNKVSALPQFMPYKAVQEERSKKIVFDPLTSSAFMPISTVDAFDANHKTFTGLVQKNFNIDRQGGTHYTTTAYPVQDVDTHLTNPSDTGTFYVNNPFFKTHVATGRHNFAPMKQQALGGTPVTTHVPYILNSGPVAAVVDQRNVSKPTGASPQLTIFYGGSVNVFDNVSPEKAQAMMYMAGNGSAMNPNLTDQRTQVQASIARPVGGDGCRGNQSLPASPCSGLSSPMSVTSHINNQSQSGSTGNDELMTVKPMGTLAAPVSQPEPSKTATSLGSSAATMMPAAVPQARKASLARFLEKRKERAMNTMPYNMDKKSPDCSTTPGSTGLSLSGNTAQTPVPASKDHSWSGLIKNDRNNEKLQVKLEM
ncbi:hypothetical protein IFM89_039724 [Coptis chinensis]|uniref:Protein TIFY n=1 Tax=Coptis chinensis TaxID=261450 RepID=A0A835GXI5_9MAGN|nr:hypothetical protein IFM89_039724 [Coptis chinensis]